MVFALAHGVYYGFVAGEAPLSTQALTSLFLFGFAGNLIFIESWSIATAFAIQAAWNINRFGLNWTAAGSRLPMPEGIGFNLVEGNVLVLGLVLALVFVTWGWTQFRRKLTG